MKKFSRIGTILFCVIVVVLSVTLPGCQMWNASRSSDANAFERPSADKPCRFG
jgi:hypothetical protein